MYYLFNKYLNVCCRTGNIFGVENVKINKIDRFSALMEFTVS